MNNAISFLYDGDDLLVQVKDKQDHLVYLKYDSSRRIIQTWKENHQNELHLNYHTSKTYTSLLDYYGHERIYFYDEEHRIISIQYPKRHSASYSYDKNYCTQIRKHNGQTVNHSYDDSGWLVRRSFSSGGNERYLYDEHQQLIQLVTKKNQTIDYTNSLMLSNAQWNKEILPTENGGTVDYVLDEFGRVIEYRWEIFKRTAKVSYDHFGNVAAVHSQEPGEELNWLLVYDSQNRLTEIHKDGNMYRKYDYDSMGNVTRVQSPTINITDHFGNVTAVHSQEQGEELNWLFVYDSQNRLTEIHKDGNMYRKYDYDPMGNVTRVQSPTINITLHYDGQGNVTQLSNETCRYQFMYDRNGRLAKAVQGNSLIVAYTRDKDGRIIEENYQNRLTRLFEHNLKGYISKIIMSDNEWLVPDYDESGNLVEVIYSDKTWEEYTYDNNGQLSTAKNLSSTVSFSYSSDNQLEKETAIFSDIDFLEFTTNYHQVEHGYQLSFNDIIQERFEDKGESGWQLEVPHLTMSP